MPYIKQTDRSTVSPIIPSASTPGELNFQITQLIKHYLGDAYTYIDINDALGALEGAKLEFYRRIVVPYEDEKIKINGDVY